MSTSNINEAKARIALALCPIMKYLRDGGIIAVNGDNTVQTTKEFFLDTFPVFEVKERRDEYEELTYTFEGVRFLALRKKEQA